MVNQRLEEIMVNSFNDVVAYAQKHKVHNRIAAYMVALDRVAFCDQAARHLRLMQSERVDAADAAVSCAETASTPGFADVPARGLL